MTADLRRPGAEPGDGDGDGDGSAEPASPPPSPPAESGHQPHRSRPRRWLRRAALGCAVLLSVTAAAFIYNGVTAGHAAPRRGLTYVQAADIRTRYQTGALAGSGCRRARPEGDRIQCAQGQPG
ncbi:hypothetical protein [Streptomyces sp. NPDC001480]|uniref:hypothetical protein n=1 Tax=Streptomyces sp. NPDC001480 TaxID=3364577 RepID=UPI0036AFF362